MCIRAFVSREGVEPPTSGFVGRRSVQLSYREISGVQRALNPRCCAEWIRTTDPPRIRRVLYQTELLRTGSAAQPGFEPGSRGSEPRRLPVTAPGIPAALFHDRDLVRPAGVEPAPSSASTRRSAL